MVKCSVISCKNRSGKNIVGVSYHRFPSHEPELQNWIKVCGRPNWKPSKHARVCSIHFEKHLFSNVGRKTTLTAFAVPTVLVCLPNDIENDIQHKLMGSIGKIKMVPGCPPSRLDCQGKLKDAGNTLLKQDGKEKPNSSNDTVEPKLDETIKCQSLVTIKEAGSLLRTPKDSNNVGRFITIAPIDNQTNKNNFVSNPVKTVRDNNHIDSIPCHYCKNPIPGFVYSCLECEYHMCHLCNIDSVHAHHYVLRGPFGRNSVEVAKVKKKVMQILKPADMEVGSDLNNTTLPIEDNIKEEKDLDFDMEIKTEIKIEEHDPLAQLGMEQRSSMFVDSLSDTNVSILPE